MTDSILTSLAVLTRIVSNPLGNVLQKQLTAKGHPALLVNFLTYGLLALGCLVISVFIPWPELPPQFWMFSLLGGFTGAIGNGFLVKALQTGQLSVLGPINAYKSVVGLLMGILLLGEVPSVWGLLGILFIILGSYGVLDTTPERFTWALLQKREIQYRILALVLTAIEAVLVKKVILASSPFIAFMSWCWFGTLFSGLLGWVNQRFGKPAIRPIRPTDWGKYGLLILSIGLMQLTTNYTLAHMPVGYALALFQLSTLVSVLLGHRIFQEPAIRKKLIGSLIMLIGSIIIILFNQAG